MESSRQSITILHTNDLHGHVTSWTGWEGDLKGHEAGGFDRLAYTVKDIRANRSPSRVLLLDAGDAIGDSFEAVKTRGKIVFTLMDKLQYDAMTPGNHEYDFGSDQLVSYAQEHSVQVLAANVFDQKTKQPVFAPYKVLERGGLRIGVIGLSYPNTPLTTSPSNVQKLSFVDDSEALTRQYLQILRSEGVDLVIILSHLGLNSDIALAKNVPGIDVEDCTFYPHRSANSNDLGTISRKRFHR